MKKKKNIRKQKNMIIKTENLMGYTNIEAEKDILVRIVGIGNMAIIINIRESRESY